MCIGLLPLYDEVHASDQMGSTLQSWPPELIYMQAPGRRLLSRDVLLHESWCTKLIVYGQKYINPLLLEERFWLQTGDIASFICARHLKKQLHLSKSSNRNVAFNVHAMLTQVRGPADSIKHAFF